VHDRSQSSPQWMTLSPLSGPVHAEPSQAPSSPSQAVAMGRIIAEARISTASRYCRVITLLLRCSFTPSILEPVRSLTDNRNSALLAGCLWVVLLVAGPLEVHARAPRRPGATVVLLAPRDRPAATRSLLQAIRGQLSDVAVRLQVAGIARLPSGRGAQLQLARAFAGRIGVTAVCWYDQATARAYILCCAPIQR
jgi:hypothetical protein